MEFSIANRIWKNRWRYIDRWFVNPVKGRNSAALRSLFRRVETALSSFIYTQYQDWVHPNRDVREIPVIINNFNRLESLRSLVAWLESAGMKNIIILDNGSTYPPLLSYYSSCPHEIVRETNLGPLALWSSRNLWRRVRNDYYIYSDSDVVPDTYCPSDVIQLLYGILRSHPLSEKIGLGLRIDDLPDHYARKTEVIAWEMRYWQRPISTNLYEAAVDTTFAMYRPRTMGGWWLRSLRTGGAYVARHVPWYQDSNNLTEEERFYVRTAKPGMSTILEGQRWPRLIGQKSGLDR